LLPPDIELDALQAVLVDAVRSATEPAHPGHLLLRIVEGDAHVGFRPARMVRVVESQPPAGREAPGDALQLAVVERFDDGVVAVDSRRDGAKRRGAFDETRPVGERDALPIAAEAGEATGRAVDPHLGATRAEHVRT